MSEVTASPPAEGTGASTEPSAAAQIIDSGAVEQQTAPTPTEPDRSEQNRAIIAAERERRRIQKEREALERTKAEIEAKRAETERLSKERTSEADQMAALLKSARGNPAKFEALLEASGLSLDDYVRFKVNGGEITPEQQLKSLDASLRDEIKAAREELDALKKERDEERSHREQQSAAQKRNEAVAFFQGEIDKALKANPDKYELTIAAGDEGEVFDLIDRAWIEKRVALTAEQAADMVEDFHRKRAERFAKTKFYSSKFQPQSPVASEAQTGKPATQAKPIDAKAKSASPAALTNQMVTSPVTPADDAAPLMTREEFLQRAKEKVRNAKKEAATARK